VKSLPKVAAAIAASIVALNIQHQLCSMRSEMFWSAQHMKLASGESAKAWSNWINPALASTSKDPGRLVAQVAVMMPSVRNIANLLAPNELVQ
jgi:hypothetical protein